MTKQLFDLFIGQLLKKNIILSFNTCQRSIPRTASVACLHLATPSNTWLQIFRHNRKHYSQLLTTNHSYHPFTQLQVTTTSEKPRERTDINKVWFCRCFQQGLSAFSVL